MFDDDFPPLAPASFFALEVEVRRLSAGPLPLFIPPKEVGRFLLPNTGGITAEETFAEVAMGWHEEGLSFTYLIDKAVERVSYPDLGFCDSVELFIDTRDRKTAGFATSFCHHFFFLPEPYLEHRCGEITRFRTEDRHPLCQPEALSCRTTKKKDRYAMEIFLPRSCLNGYNPSDFPRCGFTYRVNRPDGHAQHFSASSLEYPIEQQPSLWAKILFTEVTDG